MLHELTSSTGLKEVFRDFAAFGDFAAFEKPFFFVFRRTAMHSARSV